MSHERRPALIFCSMLGASLLAGCTSYHAPEGPTAMDSGAVEMSGMGSSFSRADAINTGYFVPDGRGRYLWVAGQNRQAMNPAIIDAQELRLKMRELAAQLLETRPNAPLAGMVALPVSFVNLNNFTETNPLGRYMAEAMFYEFNQRDIAVREYRLNGKIRMQPGFDAGEFALTRDLPPLKTSQTWGAVLVGTYLKEGGVLFINARLVRPTDGTVLRTAQLVLGDNNSLVARMSSKPTAPVGPKPPISSGTLNIVPSWSSGTGEGRVVTPRATPRKAPARKKTSVQAPAAAPIYSAAPATNPAPGMPGALDVTGAQPQPQQLPATPLQVPQQPPSLDSGTPMPNPAKNAT